VDDNNAPVAPVASIHLIYRKSQSTIGILGAEIHGMDCWGTTDFTRHAGSGAGKPGKSTRCGEDFRTRE